MKTADQITTLSNMPVKLFLYGKALTKRDKTQNTNVYGKIAFSVQDQRINAGNLNRYRNSSGFKDNGLIPMTYPFVMGFPLIMKILTSSQFPVAVLGLIHYKNQITQYTPIAETTSISLICSIADDRETALGRVFDIHIQVYTAEQLVWESTSSFLKKTADKTAKVTVEVKTESLRLRLDHHTSFTLSPFMALNYACISGDLNPIHMHKYIAKLFGFNRSIMHGMWSKARIISAFDENMLRLPARIDVKFEKPILLPAKIQLNYQSTASTAHFNLTDPTQKISHLTGTVRNFN